MVQSMRSFARRMGMGCPIDLVRRRLQTELSPNVRFAHALVLQTGPKIPCDRRNKLLNVIGLQLPLDGESQSGVLDRNHGKCTEVAVVAIIEHPLDHINAQLRGTETDKINRRMCIGENRKVVFLEQRTAAADIVRQRPLHIVDFAAEMNAGTGDRGPCHRR